MAEQGLDARALAGDPQMGVVYDNTVAYTALTKNTTQFQRVDPAGAAMANGEGRIPTYSACTATFTASTAGDIAAIIGSATKLIRVKRVAVSGRNTAGQSIDCSLIKRSTLDTGGTAAGLTAVSHDSLDLAATATATSWTTVPTTPGTSVGLVRAQQMTLSGSTVLTPVAIEWDFSTANDKAMVLRNANEGLYLNLPAAPASSATLNIFLEWSEE
jgi:hypothetical protein